MVVILFPQQLLQRVTQEKHSGRAELIAKSCLMQFIRSGGEQELWWPALSLCSVKNCSDAFIDSQQQQNHLVCTLLPLIFPS